MMTNPVSVEIVDARFEDFDGTGLYVRRSWPLFVPGNSALRATIVWNTCATNRIGDNGQRLAPLVDFDLAVVSPPNSPATPGCQGQVQLSASHSSEYEMVEERCLETSDAGGVATIQLRAKIAKGAFGKCNGDASERVALVWDLKPRH
jgi:hypothetical protein